MVQLNELSRIGFGAYRVSIHAEEHERALHHAIQCGCNVVDTAAGYGNGNSEKLIGKVLGSFESNKVFVITKAGYIGDRDEPGQVHHSPAIGGHSMHPDYLQAQIAISLQRLNRKYIDGFLLHSPEYYFTQKDRVLSTGEYYSRIGRAFEFLEEQVEKGIVRYYGVSSNTLPLYGKENATDLVELLKIASRVSGAHHFKLIQFPFNIVERGAAAPSGVYPNGLLGMAREHGILTFSNRPLNANTDSGALRLVLHDPDRLGLDEPTDRKVHDECFSIITDQLQKSGAGADISEFPMMAYLKEHWMVIPHAEAFRSLFFRSFYPFIELIFHSQTPGEAMDVFRRFQAIAWKYHLRTGSARVMDWLKSNGQEDLLPDPSSPSLPANLCMEYLRQGVDHVLVGMRQQRYVDELKALFPMESTPK